MSFAAGRWPHITESPLRVGTLAAAVLVADLFVLDRECGADPPLVPPQISAVKGFNTAVPLRPVPGFGNAAQAAVSGKPAGDQPVHSADAQKSPPPEMRENAATGPKAPSQPKSYRVRSPYERSSFPSGVPEWFKQRDADFDGQVFMWEYASIWTDEMAQAFSRLDVNGDGVITARESVARRDLGVEPTRAYSSNVRGSKSVPSMPRERVAESTSAWRAVPARSVAPSMTRERDAETTREPASASIVVEEKTQAAEIVATSSATSRPAAPHTIPQAFAAYAGGVIKRFDADRDGVLTEGEWAVMPAAPASADADGNGQITANELAVWYIEKR